MIFENPRIRTLTAFAMFAAGFTAAAMPAAAQESKVLVIEIPADSSVPPKVSEPALKIAPGEPLTFQKQGGGNIVVVFTNPGKTPFVNNRNEPVYSFRVVHAGTRFKIREDANPCTATGPDKSDCKYLVVDLKHPERPALDPYIIIR